MSGVLTTVGVGASPNACWHSAAHHTAAGTPSGLLVSRSATKGTRVFRMQRDDELLRLMLLGERVARSMQQEVRVCACGRHEPGCTSHHELGDLKLPGGACGIQ